MGLSRVDLDCFHLQTPVQGQSSVCPSPLVFDYYNEMLQTNRNQFKLAREYLRQGPVCKQTKLLDGDVNGWVTMSL